LVSYTKKVFSKYKTKLFQKLGRKAVQVPKENRMMIFNSKIK